MPHPSPAPLFLHPQVDRAVVGQPPTGLLQGPPGVRLAGEPAGKELSQGLLSLPLGPRHPPPEAPFLLPLLTLHQQPALPHTPVLALHRQPPVAGQQGKPGLPWALPFQQGPGLLEGSGHPQNPAKPRQGPEVLLAVAGPIQHHHLPQVQTFPIPPHQPDQLRSIRRVAIPRCVQKW